MNKRILIYSRIAPMKKRIGTHVIFDCHGCQTDFSKLKPKQIQQDIIQLVRQK